MKKVLLLMVCALMGFALYAQVSDNFSDYTVGGKLAQQAQALGKDYWTTWSNLPGGNEDGVIAEQPAGNKCLQLVAPNNDQILRLGDKNGSTWSPKTSGAWELTFKIYIPAGKDGYFNVKSVFPSDVSETWAMQVYMGTDEGTPGPATPGQGKIYGGAETGVSFSFSHDTWVPIKAFIDLDNDVAEFYVNDALVHTYQYSKGSFGQSDHRMIAAFNIFPPNTAATSLFYIDDVVFANASAPVVLYQTGFDDMTGTYVAQSDPAWWTTWENKPGTAEDALISTDQASSPTKSAKCAWGTDLVFKAGDKTTGAYGIEFKMYIPNNGRAFFNLLHIFAGGGSEWAVGVYFNTTGDMPNGTNVQQNNTLYPFTFPYDTWFPVKMYVDLDGNLANIAINGNEILEWQFSLKESGGEGLRQLAAVDFYPPQLGAVYYIDDFVYTMHGGETFPILNVIPDKIDADGGDVVTVPIIITNEGTSIGDYASWVAFDIEPQSGSNTFTLSHCIAASTDGLGYPSDVLVELGAKFSASDLCNKVGSSITKLAYFLPADVQGNKLVYRVYGPYSDKRPGELLAEVEKVGGLVVNSWNEITLPTSVLIDQNELWISVEFFQPNGAFPIGVDSGPLKEGVNFTRRNGGSWSEFVQTEFGNFALRATAEGGVVPGCWLSLTGDIYGSVAAGSSVTFNAVLDPSTLDKGLYEGTIKIVTNDEENPIFNIPVSFAVGVTTNCEMKEIIVNDEKATLKPGSTTAYIINFENIDQVVIDATPVHPLATLTGDTGEHEVAEGTNTFNFTITAEAGNTCEYTLDVVITIVSINEISNVVTLYPNPVVDNLYIKSDIAVEQVAVYDLTGRMVKQVKQPGVSIDLKELASGFYLLKVTTAQGETVQKFIKE